MALPRTRYRQWTVTFPWPIRYLMADDYKLITAVMNVVMRALFVWQRKMAQRAGLRGAENLAVGFIQRDSACRGRSCCAAYSRSTFWYVRDVRGR